MEPDLRRIRTILGDIPPRELGFCHSHEHLCIEKGRSFEVNSALLIDDADKTLAELLAFKRAGGCAVVDAQPVGCGRNPRVLAGLSRKSGVHILASTGFHKMIFYPRGHWIFSYRVDELERLFIRELADGMYLLCDDHPPEETCGHRAGLIKCALDAGWDAQYEKLFTAAARAAVRTGAPLMAHIEKGSDPVMLADFLADKGVELDRVIFCHMDRAIPDLETHKSLLRRGIYMEYDTIAREKYHDDEREARIVAEMIGAGFEKRLLMALDVTRERMTAYGGSVGLDYIIERFIPLLWGHGIPPEITDRIFVQNPAEAFAI